jgi:hypothetical protein
MKAEASSLVKFDDFLINLLFERRLKERVGSQQAIKHAIEVHPMIFTGCLSLGCGQDISGGTSSP